MNHDEFLPCFWLAKSTVGLETIFFVFLGNELIFRRKKYVAFVYLLKSTSLQKKSDFDFFEPCHESAILVDFCMDSLLSQH